MATVHWLGAGLSSAPGIRALAERAIRGEIKLAVWNRTVSKAQEALAGFASSDNISVEAYSLENLKGALNPGDIAVSMLPAPMHPEVAAVCLARKAHLVTTSYLSDAMKTLDAQARERGVCLVNESGLDPGLDHLLAHELVAAYRAAPEFDPAAAVTFESLCGGVPAEKSAFCYKFSWSPLGVLRALKNTAKFRDKGQEAVVDRPWKGIWPFSYRGETYEAYPNRDSLPYIEEYGLASGVKLDRFVRGTLRPAGWSQAWAQVFETVETGTPEALEKLSEKLWAEHAYKGDERDRVVLSVALTARLGDQVIWSQALCIDEQGRGRDTAMARTVSLPATFAVDAILAGRTVPGVHGAPSDRAEAKRWLSRLSKYDIAVRDARGEPVGDLL